MSPLNTRVLSSNRTNVRSSPPPKQNLHLEKQKSDRCELSYIGSIGFLSKLQFPKPDVICWHIQKAAPGA